MAEAFLGFAVAATLAIVVFVPFANEARALLFAWVVGAASVARGKLLAPRRLRLDSDGCLELAEGRRVRTGRIADGSFVAPWLIVVRWRPEHARFARTLVLLPGAASPAALRNIRVILRWA